MSPADVLLDLLYSSVSWLSSWLPRIPSTWITFVNNGVSSAAGLAAGVPYSNLIPWSTVSVVATGLPLVLGAAFAARMMMRIWAWFRSRGAADQ